MNYIFVNRNLSNMELNSIAPGAFDGMESLKFL